MTLTVTPARSWRSNATTGPCGADSKQSSSPVAHQSPTVASSLRSGEAATGRQVPLARALASVDVVGLDDLLSRRAGVLLGRARTSDAIDAAVVLLASDDDRIVASDADDIERLVSVAGLHVEGPHGDALIRPKHCY